MLRNRFLSVLLGMLLWTAAYAEESNQPLDSIYSFVKETIAANMGSNGDFEINVLPLDTQLKLAACSKPLAAYKTNNLVKVGRVSIGVHCSGEKQWSIFVSAIIKVYAPVIVLTRPVQRGDIIGRDTLSVERMDVSNTRGDYITEAGQVENKEAARNLPSGTILWLKSIVEPPLIKRKDKVSIHSDEAGFSVQMSGTALMDGAKGQAIRVKNESSGRVVSGIVLEAGVVVVK